MDNYKALIAHTIQLARARLSEIGTEILKGQHLCGDPSCVESGASLDKQLALYKESWDFAINYAFRTQPEGIRTLLLKETELHAEIIASPSEDQLRIMVAFYPVFAPLLEPLFPNEPMPSSMKVLRSIVTPTSWAAPPLSLFWVETPTHEHDWFVVAPGMQEAVLFYGESIGVEQALIAVKEVGVTSAAVSKHTHQQRTGWASPEAVWSAGGHITKFNFPRSARFGEVEYHEGKVPLRSTPSVLSEIKDKVEQVVRSAIQEAQRPQDSDVPGEPTNKKPYLN